MNDDAANQPSWVRRYAPWLAGLLLIVALATFGVTALLVTVFEHRQEAQRRFIRLVEVDEVTSDPVPWGKNWPFQFDSYKRTVDTTRTSYGGSSAMPESKLKEDPWLKRLYAGYAFSIDYRERRGHAYMLYDQQVTERVTKRQQSGACLHCHASIVPTYRRVGLEAMGEPADAEALAKQFAWPAVMKGFEAMSTIPYEEAYAKLLRTPDGTPGESEPLFPQAERTIAPDAEGEAHPVSCVDCHEPDTMASRVTRPAFVKGIAALAESDEPVPHLPSIERWREGSRSTAYDPNELASRQEMRIFVCAQCHVEYYCANRETLFYPWDNGLKAEQIESTYEQHAFPDGTPFYDYEHGETGARVYKAQHPEFELWSQGVHARSGVTCADCHMPYERKGAMKVSSHWVRSPLLNINNACQTCHNVPEEELRDKVRAIQTRTESVLDRAAIAMTDMLDAIRAAQASGAGEAQLAELFTLQKRAMWRLDYISSENSMGFHAGQEAVRILAESIDYSRQAEAQAVRLRASEAPDVELPVEPIQGVTPEGEAPIPEDGQGAAAS
jgi:nitrite reductase (cytochrome c-552)